METGHQAGVARPAMEMGALACAGGGRIAISSIPGLGGDLAGDIARIGDWDPRVVVTMTTTAEMKAAGAATLGASLEVLGIAWLHLPVPDYHSLQGNGDAQWPAVSKQLHAVLADGGGVYIHCHGGRGRSGMIALRLLVELGEEPDAALERLRAVRTGAVETDDQFAWAANVEDG